MYEAFDRAEVWAMDGACMGLNVDSGFDNMKVDYPVDYLTS